jgi:cyclopropane fatty-acyl-phospholipid synthase-like methyltransferase
MEIKPSIKFRNIYWDTRFEKGFIYGTRPSKAVKFIFNYIKNEKSLLILGGGYGRNAVWFAKKGFNVLNTDISNNAINLGKNRYRKFQNLKFKRLDVSKNFNFKNSFDAIIALYCLNLFTSQELLSIMKNIRKKLKRGGKFCANFLSIKDDEYGSGTKIEKNTFLYSDGQIVKFFTKREIVDLFKKYNFKIDKIINIKEKRKIKTKRLTSHSYLVLSERL